MNKKRRYYYQGPVTQFGRIIFSNWYGETAAVSDKKARSNLMYQFKQEYRYVDGAKIELPGKVCLIEE